MATSNENYSTGAETDIASRFEPFQFVGTRPCLAVFLLVVLGIATLLGTLGNVLILVSVATQRELRNVESVFIVNLALCDLYVTMLADPLSILAKTVGWRWFESVPYLCRAVGSLCTISCVGSLMTLSAMAFNRYILICHHSLYRRLFTFRNSILMCSGVYVVGLLLVFLNFAGVGDHSFDHKSLECIWDRMANHDYTIVFAIVLVWVPIVITGLSYMHIYLHVRASRMRVHNHSSVKAVSSLVPEHEASRNGDKERQPDVQHPAYSERSAEGNDRPDRNICDGSELRYNATMDKADNSDVNSNVSGVWGDNPTVPSAARKSRSLPTADENAQLPKLQRAVTFANFRNKERDSSEAGSHDGSPPPGREDTVDKDQRTTESGDSETKSRSLGDRLRGTFKSLKRKKSMNSSLKLARTLFIIYLVFSACWLPYSFILILDAQDTFAHELHVLIVVWAHLHPSINWLVYYHTNIKFRKSFRKLLRIDRNGD